MAHTPAHLRQLTAARPRDAKQLHRFVQRALGLTIPTQPLAPTHTPPFAYLAHVFFEGRGALSGHPEAGAASPDCVVWANRGGGKTLLGAVATLLDLVFKPGIDVRILGGSLAQSAKMYEHLAAMLDRPLLRPALAQTPTQRRVVLQNGSTAEILAQSHKAVRGVRVHKLRCDEIEQFDPDIWEAAQLVTRSGPCGDVHVTGSVEALSTMHRPGGLMGRLIDEATADETSDNQPVHKSASESVPRRLFKWNALDVIERCPPSRPCKPCVLWSDCEGSAKQAGGFIPVDDLVTQWHRTSDDTWQAEMLCRQPKRQDRVYPNFDPNRHIVRMPPLGPRVAPADARLMLAGMDFGLRSPTVWLWAQWAGETQAADAPIHVVGEYQETGRTLEQHLKAIDQQAAAEGWPGVKQLAWVGIDPAGRQRSSHTGLSDVEVLRRHGLTVRARVTPLRDGIERIRRRLDRGTLTIDPRCERLIAALGQYHFDAARPLRDQPVKDGPDHACDALRYLITNLELGPRPVSVRQWA
jgi:hypothetical protein